MTQAIRNAAGTSCVCGFQLRNRSN